MGSPPQCRRPDHRSTRCSPIFNPMGPVARPPRRGASSPSDDQRGGPCPLTQDDSRPPSSRAAAARPSPPMSIGREACSRAAPRPAQATSILTLPPSPPGEMDSLHAGGGETPTMNAHARSSYDTPRAVAVRIDITEPFRSVTLTSTTTPPRSLDIEFRLRTAPTVARTMRARNISSGPEPHGQSAPSPAPTPTEGTTTRDDCGPARPFVGPRPCPLAHWNVARIQLPGHAASGTGSLPNAHALHRRCFARPTARGRPALDFRHDLS